MADLGGKFDANKVEPASEFEPIPEGEYAAVIVDSKRVGTSTGGERLVFEFDILDAPYAGRKIWEGLNLWNKSETAVDIAKKQLSALCRAVNVMTPRDSAELHNIPLKIKVVRRKRSDNGQMTNEIKGYSSTKIEDEVPF